MRKVNRRKFMKLAGTAVLAASMTSVLGAVTVHRKSRLHRKHPRPVRTRERVIRGTPDMRTARAVLGAGRGTPEDHLEDFGQW